MTTERFVVRRRFSDWLGEVFDVIDTEDGATVAVVHGHLAGKVEAESIAARENKAWKLRKEVAMRE